MSTWSQQERDRLPTRRHWRTAIHEAGHATLAIREGRVFQDIVIRRDGNTNAKMRNISIRLGDDERVRILLAGIMAVRLVRRRWDYRLFSTAWDDLGAVCDFFKDHPERDRALRWNVSATEQLLLIHWDAVLNIARKLVLERTISYAEALRLFQSSERGSRDYQPMESMDASGWQPLIEHINFRQNLPNGIEDAIRAHGFLISGREPEP